MQIAEESAKTLENGSLEHPTIDVALWQLAVTHDRAL